MIGEYTSWFENLDIYQEWMINLPEPFNNVAFASAAFLAAVFFLLTAAVNRILLIRWNARQRRDRKHTDERRRQEMEEQRERERHSREDREQMDLYLHFLMTAQMQNFTSLQGITFGQWKSQMLAEQAAGGAGWAAGNTGGETGKETGGGINTGAEESMELEINVETAVPDLQEMISAPEEGSLEKAEEEPVEKNGNLKQAEIMAQAGESCLPERAVEKISLMKEEKGSSIPMGSGPDGCGSIYLSGEFNLPARCLLDNTVGKTAEPGGSQGSLRSVDMAAVMEQIRRDGDPGAAEGLSPEQQGDFAKVLARMQEDERQHDYLERFQREKSEIIRNNLSVLEQSIYMYGGNCEAGMDAEKTTGVDEEMERRKAAAREAIRRAEQLGQEKGKKKMLFGRRK